MGRKPDFNSINHALNKAKAKVVGGPVDNTSPAPKQNKSVAAPAFRARNTGKSGS